MTQCKCPSKQGSKILRRVKRPAATASEFREQLAKNWQQIIEFYSELDLTFSSDTFPAISDSPRKPLQHDPTLDTSPGCGRTRC